MPLFDFVCMSGHITERLLRRELLDVTACEVCKGPAARQPFGAANQRTGYLIGTEKVSNYSEAAREMEYHVKRSDDPALKGSERIWHAAKVRSEAQMLAGATRWRPDKKWDHKEVE